MTAKQTLPVGKLTTQLLAQILTYYFNGIVDAKITDELVQYFYTGGRSFASSGTVTQERAAALLTARAGQENSAEIDFLIGLAFTVYRTNGYGNYICARRLHNSLRLQHRAEIDHFLTTYIQHLEKELDVYHDYQQEQDGWLPFVGFWMETGLRTFKQAQLFAVERFGHRHKLNKKQVVRACLTVQRQNSAHNLSVGQRLLESAHSSDPKIKLLQAAAIHFSQPDIFLRSCALTQQIAAHSDRTLVGLLKLRFPRVRI